MKFSFKVFISTILIVAISMGFGGFYLVDSMFKVSQNREKRQALDENDILCFALETVALNFPLKYDNLQNNTIIEIAKNLETSSFIRISDENKKLIYSGIDLNGENNLISKIDQNTKAVEIMKEDDRYYIHIAVTVNVIDRVLYLETIKDITTIYRDKEASFLIYRNVIMATLIMATLIMYIFSIWLTRPIRHLTRAAKNMAAGNLQTRARKVSNDEIGLLTQNFNNMADALEDKVLELQEEAAARENFLGAFAHELKTPLTAIIGYADLLRSRKLNDEHLFLSADYIYKEGKRLEALSFRLLEIVVLKKDELFIKKVNVTKLFYFLEDSFQLKNKFDIQIEFEKGFIYCEIVLIESVLINLIDNAMKAYTDGGIIEVTGKNMDDKYMFSVKDYGRGIDQEDLNKITRAFYMVDKSRSREHNGVGLGLSLCNEILALHESQLEFESEIGKGTTVSFSIKK